VNENTILTNRRIVEGLGPNGEILAVSSGLGTALNARVLVASQPESLRDYAFLRVEPGPNAPKGLKLGPEPKVGDRVMAFGYPGGKYEPGVQPAPIYARGRVSSVALVREVSVIGHTAEMSRRFRGGPLVDRAGRVVGLGIRAPLAPLDDQDERRAFLALGTDDVMAFASENSISLD
jgi:S1-C subfamily serine protease